MMPADLNGGERLPDLCNHHEQVVRALSAHDHIDDRDSERVAEKISGQCCDTGRDLR